MPYEEGSTQEVIDTDNDSESNAENQEVEVPGEDTEFDVDAFEKEHDLGVYAPWWSSPERTYLKEDLDANVRSALVSLRQLASRSDIAARRFEVEQAWEVDLFERGYQHLTARKGGGFDLPGEDTRWGPTAQINRANLLNTNITSKTHDILVGAICREIPRVQFLPQCPDNNAEVTAAQTADKFKLIYQRNNKMRVIMRDVASLFCREDRVVLLTGFFKDATQYGYEGDTPEAVSPEDMTTALGIQTEEMQELDSGKTDDEQQEGQEQNPLAQMLSSLVPEQEEETETRVPKGMELTKVFGKLANKVPITSKDITTMPWLQLFEDLDESFVKAMFPFAKNRIRPEGTDSAEIELDRIARMNTNLAIQGKYVTGDSMQRLTTVCYTFMRPSFFYASEVRDEVKEQLCELFPDGCLVITAGTEFIMARNCNMNDHVVIGHPYPESGQNRRSLLTNIIPIQKRLNDWMDLMGDFFVRTVPKRYYDQTSFDIELIQSQDNTPGGAIPFMARPGIAFSQLMGTDPMVQNQPAMAEFIKWFEGELNDDISGALASIYGGAVDVNTVGNAQIQRDQALGRINSAWLAIQEMFAESHRQAVKAAALNRKNDMDESVPGFGRVTVEIAKMRGNVLCYPEYDPSFPESSAQKEMRFFELWKSAEANPGGPSAKLLSTPKNLKVAKDVMRFGELEIPGSDEYEKQQGEFEILCKTGPVPNPEIAKLKEQILEHHMQIMSATEGMKQDMLNNSLDQQEMQQAAPKMDMLEQQVELMAQQIQQLEKDWPEVSTVPVREDKSENHAIEAQACYDWMNSPEGRRYNHGSPEEQDVFRNIYLHWKKHVEVDGKLNPPQASFKTEGISFSGDLTKLPSDVASQVLLAAGFQTDPSSFDQKVDSDTKNKIKERTAPKVITKLTRS
jgi:hypothetical protein